MSDRVGSARARPPWSLQRRLIAGIVCLLAVVSIVVGAVTVAVQRQDLLSRLDDQLQRSAGFGDRGGDGPQFGQPSSGVGTGNGTGTGQAPDFGGDDGSPGRRLGSLFVAESSSGVLQGEYTDDDGQAVTLTDAQLAVLSAADIGTTPVSVDLGGDLGTFRVAASSGSGGGSTSAGRIITGMSLADLDTTVQNSILIFGGVTLVALLITGFGGALVVRVALRPLQRIVTTAGEVAAKPLSSGEVAIPERVSARDSDPRTEVGQVGAALNQLLGNVEQALSDRQESEDRLRRFVADASHELRTPLASIRGYAELSQRDETPMSDTQTRALERIGAESVRMSSLVEDLLLLARLDAGQPLRSETVDMTLVLADAISDAWAADQDHQWELDVDLDGDTGAGGVEVQGDPHRLHQVIANLLGNARVHTPAGTRVVAALAMDGPMAVVTITDEGTGISPDLLPHIFERFARGDSSRARESGSSGLGLSIVSAIVKSHGGTITATSSPHGTTFTLQLPLAG